MKKLIVFILALLPVITHATRRGIYAFPICGDAAWGHVTVVDELVEINIQADSRWNNADADAYVTYTINCPKTTYNLPLCLLAPSFTESRYVVWVDNKLVNVYLKPVAFKPDMWKAPLKVPFKNDAFFFNYTTDGLMLATVIDSLPPGKHQISVGYDIYLGVEEKRNYLSAIGTFSYFFAPKNYGPEFNGLTIRVTTPKDWAVESNLPLQKKYGSSFFEKKYTTNYPACLTLAAYKPNGNYALYSTLFIIAAWIVFTAMAGIWFFYWQRLLWARRYHRIIRWLNCLAVALAFAIFNVWVTNKNCQLMDEWLDNRYAHDALEHLFGNLLVSLILFTGVLIITLVLNRYMQLRQRK